MEENKKKKHYSVNTQTKVLIIDDSVKATKEDKEDIKLYLSAGYKLRHKVTRKISEELKQKNSIKAEDIKKAMEGTDPEAYKQYQKIVSEHNFFSGKKYYLEWLDKQKSKEEHKKSSTAQKAKKEAAEQATRKLKVHFRFWGHGRNYLWSFLLLP